MAALPLPLNYYFTNMLRCIGMGLNCAIYVLLMNGARRTLQA